jgi:hypothetical protein
VWFNNYKKSYKYAVTNKKSIAVVIKHRRNLSFYVGTVKISNCGMSK